MYEPLKALMPLLGLFVTILKVYHGGIATEGTPKDGECKLAASPRLLHDASSSETTPVVDRRVLQG